MTFIPKIHWFVMILIIILDYNARNQKFFNSGNIHFTHQWNNIILQTISYQRYINLIS